MKKHFYYSCGNRKDNTVSDIKELTCINCLKLLSTDKFFKHSSTKEVQARLKEVRKINDYNKEFEALLK